MRLKPRVRCHRHGTRKASCTVLRDHNITRGMCAARDCVLPHLSRAPSVWQVRHSHELTHTAGDIAAARWRSWISRSGAACLSRATSDGNERAHELADSRPLLDLLFLVLIVRRSSSENACFFHLWLQGLTISFLFHFRAHALDFSEQ